MFMNLGHQVFHLGHEESKVNCTEHISVTNTEIIKKCYGEDYDMTEPPPNAVADDSAFQHFHKEAERELRKRIQPDDIVLSLFGWADKPLIDRIQDLPCHIIEASIGYPDSAFQNRVFQSPCKFNFERGRSSATLHMRADFPDSEPAKKFRTWERLTENEPDTQSTVIPPMTDPRDIEYSENKKDYMILVGRINRCKGLDIAIKLAEYTDTKLIIAGMRDKHKHLKNLSDREYLEYVAAVKVPDNVEFIGTADLKTRSTLYRDARVAVFMSRFLEPGHNTHIEANMAGTPIIVPNHGITMDYVMQGVNGFLCHPDDFSDVVDAYESIDQIKPSDCRDYAMNFSLDRISLMYHNWFHKVIQNSHRDFWEVIPKDNRIDKDWLRFPEYPYPHEKVKQKIVEIRHKIASEAS